MTELIRFTGTIRSISGNQRALITMAAFTAYILFLAVLIHRSVDAGLRRIETSSYGVWNRIVDGRINADIVISGSSRAMRHYDPRPISDALGLAAYNIGLNGAQTDMQLARLRTYLDHNAKPSLIIHNLDIFSLQLSHGGVYDLAQYVPYLGEDDIYSALANIYPPIWKSKYVPLYGYTVEDLRFTWMMGLGALTGWNPPEDHVLGFKAGEAAWTEDFDKLRVANPDGVTFNIEAGGVRAMEDMLTMCRERGIKIILVYSPEYSALQELTKDRAATFRVFETLAQRYGAELWDYSDSLISDDRNNFYNSQHLNRTGAEAFSRQLANRLASAPIREEMAILARSRGQNVAPAASSSP